MKKEKSNKRITSICRECLSTFDSKVLYCANCESLNLISHKEIEKLDIAHVDCDAFYASIEKRDNPKLKNSAVIIGGGKRGVVATACYLARIKGVRSAMPMYKALKLCPSAIIIKPNMSKYRDASRKIQNLMNQLTPLTEPISLDEAFLDLSGTKKLHKKIPAVLLAELSKKINQEVGISVSIGLSYNKFLAKICSDLDKPKGFSLLGRGDSKKFLSSQPVEILWGVGKILKRKLNDDGIKTISQIEELGIKEVINRYGSIGSHIYSLSQGKDLRRVVPQRQIKSISHETTFENDISDKEVLEKKLWSLCEKVSKRSKEKGLGGQTITLKLKTKEFKLISRSCTIDEPTQIGELIFQNSKTLLDREDDKIKYRLIGVGISNLKDSELCDLYDLINISKTKNAKIEYAIDDIRNKFGKDLIKKGRSI
ncbi:MAG: DNA polymerase IV [Alphaproteobacteria bacterium]|nr:MAG: DNA polymerase IV [alpha proteobacterium MED-G09]